MVAMNLSNDNVREYQDKLAQFLLANGEAIIEAKERCEKTDLNSIENIAQLARLTGGMEMITLVVKWVMANKV